MKSPANATPEVPDHELLREIGRGNYGKVWLGRNILGTLRAIKVVHRGNFLDDRPYDREYAGIMKYEPLSRSHPGLVAVLHVGRHAAQKYFYYIMDLADDVERRRHIDVDTYQPRTLRSDLNRNVRMPIEECVHTGLALCSALGYLHRHGVVHRDIKPSNIIFVDNEPKFADIGLVEDIGETSTYVGSEGYTPPEGPGNPTADLYGLGKVLYELCTGLDQRKFPSLPPDFQQWPDARSRERLFNLTRQACEFNPRRRFQSAGEMYSRLELVLEATTLGGRPKPPSPSAALSAPRRVVLVGDLLSGNLPGFAAAVEAELTRDGCEVFVDRPVNTTVEQARRIETALSRADVVVALLTPSALQKNEMLSYELQLAQAESQQAGGRPVIAPILINLPDPPPPEIAELIGAAPRRVWTAPHETAEGLRLIRSVLEPPRSFMRDQASVRLESVGGAVPLDSPFYLTRPADTAVRSAIHNGESIVLIKGGRQMGKTSLLARGLQEARDHGMRVALTDLQQFNAANFESIENLYFALGNSLADSLSLDVFPEDTWSNQRSPNRNLEHYLREQVLAKAAQHFVWAIDELDRLLPCAFGSEVFGLFRSWHNRRALDPSTPWARLTLAMAYATEANLFIRDLNQSPFNVGVRVALEDFSPEQVGEMNQLYGNPLKSGSEVEQLIRLVGGQPFLVRSSLHEMVTHSFTLEQLRAEAEKENGIFGDHLRRLVMLLAKDPALLDAVRGIVEGKPCSTPEAFHRLRAAGVLIGSSAEDARLRCELYQRFLRRSVKS